MAITNQLRRIGVGTYDDSESSWTQPTVQKRVKGVDLVKWNARAVGSDFNGAVVTVQLQGTLEGDDDSLPDDNANWITVGTTTFTAAGAGLISADGYNDLSIGNFSFFRWQHSITGDPNVDITVTNTIVGDYVD